MWGGTWDFAAPLLTLSTTSCGFTVLTCRNLEGAAPKKPAQSSKWWSTQGVLKDRSKSFLKMKISFHLLLTLP